MLQKNDLPPQIIIESTPITHTHSPVACAILQFAQRVTYNTIWLSSLIIGFVLMMCKMCLLFLTSG